MAPTMTAANQRSRCHWMFNTNVLFITWTMTSFLDLHFGKVYLTNATSNTSSDEDYILLSSLHALSLTVLQFGFLAAFTPRDGKESLPRCTASYAFLYQLVATYATNFSLALLIASSTAAIILTEPVFSVFLQCICLHQSPPRRTFLCLFCVLGGAALFVGMPDSLAQCAGVMSGLIATLMLAFSSHMNQKIVTSKKVEKKSESTLINLMSYPLLLLVIVGLSMGLLYKLEGNVLFMKGASLVLLLSAICHVVSSLHSTSLDLEEMSSTRKTFVKIMRRTLVVLLFWTHGDRVSSPCNFLGFAICVIALVLYTWDGDTEASIKHTDIATNSDNQKRSTKKVVMITSTLIMSLTLIASIFFQCSSHVPKSIFQKITSSSSSSDVSRDRVFTSQTFYHDAFVRPSEESLMPDLNKLPPDTVENVPWFLQQRLVDMPRGANFISSKLKTTHEVIREAQRLHFNILGDMLKKYKYALWFDVSAFENKGDSCVTVGETYFLRRLNIEVLYYCNFFACNSNKMNGAKNISLNYSPDDLVIIGHGGGNLLGYFRNDNIRYGMINRFKKYKILIFPQGIWIPKNNENTDLIKKAIKMYCCVPNLTIVLRERASYDIAKRLFKGSTQLLMAPDIAFQVGPVQRIISPVFDILWLKRDDKEDPGKLKIPPYPPNLTVHASEWIHWVTNRAGNKLEQAHYNAANGHLYIQRGRVVITDRLHGHIFSILNDIPHVLVDPLGSKLTNYHYTWTASLTNTRVARNAKQAMQLALELLKEYDDILPAKIPFLNLREDFKPYRPGRPDMSYT